MKIKINHLKNTLAFRQKVIDIFCLKIKKNISDDSFKALIDNDNLDIVWNVLKDNNDIGLFNLILTIKYCYFNLNLETSFNNIEKKIYQNVTKEEFCFLLLVTWKKILENIFNEMIKKDTDIINKPIWTSVNLDSLYSLNLDHISYNFIQKKKFFELYKKIITVNVIISSIDRLDGVYLYTKLKDNKNYPQELLDNIKFTKGYLVCFTPELTEKFKNFKYMRKLIRNQPLFIKKKKKKLNFMESLLNENFTNPIWLNKENLNLLELEKYNIYNKYLLKKNSKIDSVISSLNFLNSIKLTYDLELWENLVEGLEKSTDISSTLSTKNKLERILLNINTHNTIDEINSNVTNLQSLITSASVQELISKQLKYYNYFYLDHKLDARLRIYCYPWPINYQLNHVVRVILKFHNIFKIKKILENFKKNYLIKKYARGHNFLEHKKIKNLTTLDSIFNAFNIKENDAEILDFKKEWVFYLMCKLAPKNIKKNEEKLKFSIQIFENFIQDDLSENWKKWMKILKLKEKKFPYLFSLQKSIRDLKNDKYETIFWGDASSNAIQLITFRLRLFNNELLKYTNIIDNETEYENIYDYVTEEIKKTDHTDILKKLNNKITLDELLLLLEKDVFKFLIMPSSYGMGKRSYRDKLDKILIENNKKHIWEKLSKVEQKILSNKLWELCDECLGKIGYGLDNYKNSCKKFWKKNDYDIFVWKNDMSVTIAPITIEKTSRQEIRDSLNRLKLTKSTTLTEEQKIQLAEKEKKLNQKLNQDDNKNWKRTRVKSSKNNIFVRIPYQSEKKLNKHSTKQSLIPNTIHAYDASVAHVVIKICERLGIEVLVIHDSIGCHPLLAPLVKTIFKVVNIHFLELSFQEKKFPLQETELQEIGVDEKKLLYKKILESKNFFR